MSGSFFNSDGTPRRKPLGDVLRHIAGFSFEHGGETPTVLTIAMDLGITTEQVCRKLKLLEAKGWISLSRQPLAGKPYHIHLLHIPVFAPQPSPPWFDAEAALISDWGGALPERPVFRAEGLAAHA